MKAFKFVRRLVAIGSLSVISMLAGVSNADPVVVSPANMHNWTLNSFDGNGNIVNSGPYYGIAAMVTGPATPPLGVGSAELATPTGAGDGGAAIATESYDGTLLTSITALSYSSYDVTNNGQQFPYLAISINTGSIDNAGDSGATVNTTDTLFFEPPYQQTTTGNPTLPNQATPTLHTWQTWNAFVGGYWDNNNIAGTGTGVMPLSTFETDYPLATIENGGLAGLGGIALQVGFASSGDTYQGYVDNVTIGVAGVNTTYDFEPTPVPEPASFSLIGVGALALLRRRRRQA
jgi:hypothetical protein